MLRAAPRVWAETRPTIDLYQLTGFCRFVPKYRFASDPARIENIARSELAAGLSGALAAMAVLTIPTFKGFNCKSMDSQNANMSERTLIHKGYQTTLNQRVQGSSPCAPTIDFTRLPSLHP